MSSFSHLPQALPLALEWAFTTPGRFEPHSGSCLPVSVFARFYSASTFYKGTSTLDRPDYLPFLLLKGLALDKRSHSGSFLCTSPSRNVSTSLTIGPGSQQWMDMLIWRHLFWQRTQGNLAHIQQKKCVVYFQIRPGKLHSVPYPHSTYI